MNLGNLEFGRLLLLLCYKHQHSGRQFNVAYVQVFKPSKHKKVDKNGYDTRFSLPKVVPKKRYKLVDVNMIVRPIRMMPDFELLEEEKTEYFVRYNIEQSSIVDKVYAACVRGKEKQSVQKTKGKNK